MTADLTPSARILIVEDNVAVARSLEILLTYLGHRCAATASAEEAERLDHQLFDLALVDILLPGASGLAFADRIAARRPGIGIILMTGSPAHLHHPVAGFRRVLLKPFRPRNLEEAIAHALRQRRRVEERRLAPLR
ncbi:response regulator [Sphingomonas sp. YL-JM2C]